ncbi:MAG: GntR family transcriptional regulator [Deltaproteobacteria bacterium]|nr:GntR family transcriptional regulator [Deltaproteobacteria bacterium]
MQKIAARSLHQDVASRIREMIRKGVLTKGQRVVEAELCAAVGVSRTPLREALRVLSSEGLIRLVPNKGAFVSEPSLDDVREMFEVMSILEGTCARMAAERMGTASLAKLERLHDKLEQHYARGDRDGYIKKNNTFHELVQELTGNRILNGILNGLREKILLYRYRQIFEAKRFDESIHEHRDILSAFRNRDPEAAEALMKSHLVRQGRALVRVYEANTPAKPTA